MSAVHHAAAPQSHRGIRPEEAVGRLIPTGNVSLLRLPAVLQRVGLGRSAVYDLIKQGKFPSPVKAGGASAWPDNEIDTWIASLVAERDTQFTRKNLLWRAQSSGTDPRGAFSASLPIDHAFGQSQS